MIRIGKKREQEGFFGFPDKIPDFLRIPYIEDRIIKVPAGLVVLDDLKTVPGLQLVEQLVDDHTLFEIKAYGEPVGVTTLVIKIDQGDIGARGRGITQEVIEGSRLVWQVDAEFQKIESFDGRLQVPYFCKFIRDLTERTVICGDFIEDSPRVYPTIKLDAIDISIIFFYYLSNPVQ
jgi:hypothetical protein